MGKIMMLEEVANEVTASPTDCFAMFGFPNYLKMGTVLCDLMFHAIKDIYPQELDSEPFRAIPVLPLNEDYDSAADIFRAFESNRVLRTFAVRTKDPKVEHYEQKSETKQGISLDFFDVEPIIVGAEIIRRDDYHIASDAEFREQFESWDAVLKNIGVAKGILDRRYAKSA